MCCALLAFGYLYMIGIIRSQKQRKTNTFSHEYGKGLLSLCICTLTLLVYFAKYNYS
jgi:hypothetical protein